jgi:hypothetical protein
MTVTTVPPAVVPLFKLSADTVGAVPVVYVNWSEDETAEVPVGVVTTTSTVPAAKGGDTAVMDESEFTTNDAASTPPNVTRVPPVNPLPLIATDVPPAELPLVVPRPVTLGLEAAVYVNLSAPLGADVMPLAVTDTFSAPAACDGDTAWMLVSFTTR